jgi:ferredoxin
MLCTACCPSEALIANGINFLALLERLQQLSQPVIACHHYPDLQAHENTACLGWLGEEYLVVLVANLPSSLQLNLIRCQDCPNGFIVEVLKRNLESVAAKTGMKVSEKIFCVEDKAVLDYQQRVQNRRNFFGALKNRTVRGVVEVVDSGSPPQKGLAYNHKTLPLKRTLLNDVLSRVSGKIRENIVTNYYYDAIIHDQCDACAVCVAACPTGALSINGRHHAGNDLIFEPSRCHGCQLCAAACGKNAIQIKELHEKARD